MAPLPIIAGLICQTSSAGPWVGGVSLQARNVPLLLESGTYSYVICFIMRSIKLFLGV